MKNATFKRLCLFVQRAISSQVTRSPAYMCAWGLQTWANTFSVLLSQRGNFSWRHRSTSLRIRRNFSVTWAGRKLTCGIKESILKDRYASAWQAIYKGVNENLTWTYRSSSDGRTFLLRRHTPAPCTSCCCPVGVNIRKVSKFREK